MLILEFKNTIKVSICQTSNGYFERKKAFVDELKRKKEKKKW